MRAEDLAQELELKEYEATQQRAIAHKRPSLSHCEDCGEEIPEPRRRISGITRCLMCQEDFESLKKRGA